MKTYRLGSAPMVFAPGFIRWAIAGARFESDRPQLVRIVAEGWNVPAEAAEALLSGRAPFDVDGETVVFQA
jgi:hypothetical protein